MWVTTNKEVRSLHINLNFGSEEIKDKTKWRNTFGIDILWSIVKHVCNVRFCFWSRKTAEFLQQYLAKDNGSVGDGDYNIWMMVTVLKSFSNYLFGYRWETRVENYHMVLLTTQHRYEHVRNEIFLARDLVQQIMAYKSTKYAYWISLLFLMLLSILWKKWLSQFFLLRGR